MFPALKSLARNSKYVFFKNGMLPIYLIVAATGRCNLRCRTCFNYEMLDANPEDELTTDEHEKIARSLKHVEWVLFSGGEPTLRDDLAEVASRYAIHSGTRRFTVPTNALLSDKTLGSATKLLEKLPDAHIAFSLAIDGPKEIHDAIREHDGSFDALLETYKLLAELKRNVAGKYSGSFSINLNTVVMNENIGAMDEFLGQCPALFPEADFHGFEMLRGTSPDKTLNPPTPEQYDALIGKLKIYWQQYDFYKVPLGRVLRGAKILAREMELDVIKSGKPFNCNAGWINGVIGPRGELSFCEDLDFTVGNLRDVDFDFGKLWFSEKAEILRGKVKSGCTCTNSCFVSSSLLFNPGAYPKLLKKSFI